MFFLHLQLRIQIRNTKKKLKHCMNEEKTREVWKNRIKWRAFLSTYPSHGQQARWHVCTHLQFKEYFDLW